jgi:hypothetical protein
MGRNIRCRIVSIRGLYPCSRKFEELEGGSSDGALIVKGEAKRLNDNADTESE